MRRHEMVQNIATAILISAIDELDICISYDKALNMADVVLKRIEKEGMVAPLSDEYNQINSKYYGWDVDNEEK